MFYISKKSIFRIIPYLIVLFFATITIVPILWVFSTSIKPMSEIRTWPPYWIPKHSQFISYVRIFTTRPFLQYTANSAIVASVSTAICVLLGLFTGYSLSRKKFKGRTTIALLILATRLFPPIALISPWYGLASKFNLINTRLVLIIAYIYMNLPFVVWIMLGFFDRIPREIDDAGKIDGCNKLSLLRYILIPLAGPGIATASIFTFLLSWNEYLLAAVLTVSPSAKTIPVGVMEFISDEFIVWNQLCSASIMASIPAFVFVLLFQQYIVKGLTAGAVKG